MLEAFASEWEELTPAMEFDPVAFETTFRALREEYGNAAVITLFLPACLKGKLVMDYPLHFFVTDPGKPDLITLFVNEELDNGDRMRIISQLVWEVKDTSKIPPEWHITDNCGPVDFWERCGEGVEDWDDGT